MGSESHKRKMVKWLSPPRLTRVSSYYKLFSINNIKNSSSVKFSIGTFIHKSLTEYAKELLNVDEEYFKVTDVEVNISMAQSTSIALSD